MHLHGLACQRSKNDLKRLSELAQDPRPLNAKQEALLKVQHELAPLLMALPHVTAGRKARQLELARKTTMKMHALLNMIGCISHPGSGVHNGAMPGKGCCGGAGYAGQCQGMRLAD